MKRLATVIATVSLGIPLAAVIAQTKLSSTTAFEADITTVSGKSPPLHVDIQTWELLGRGGAEQEIPLQGFYVAHLLGGQVASVVSGTTVQRKPGDYWTVAAGTHMQVKVLREFAILETIVPTSR